MKNSISAITKFNTIESFETERLLARKLSENDFDLILPTYQNEQVMQTLGGVISKEDAYKKFKWNLERWEQQGFGSWLWFDKVSNQFVGRAGLRAMELENHPVIEVGYILLPEFWNQGLATEMAKASVEIGFKHLKLKELVAFTLLSNQASQHVMEKMGFKFSHHFIYEGDPHVLYRLTVEDYSV